MKYATICYLLKSNPHRQLLLGYKKTGFGAGKYNGPGGKIEPGETAAQAAIREVEEEVGLRIAPEDMRPMGQIEFRFPYKPEWDQVVHIFVAEQWQGEPVESRELAPPVVPPGRAAVPRHVAGLPALDAAGAGGAAGRRLDQLQRRPGNRGRSHLPLAFFRNQVSRGRVSKCLSQRRKGR